MTEINSILKLSLPAGFRAAGIHSGIYKKNEKPDLAIFVSDKVCRAAGMFTTNKVKAAPIIVSQKHMRHGKISAIIANSGCANACTGEKGLIDADQMCASAAHFLKLKKEQILVASTGVIGQFLPMEKIETGIKTLATKLKSSSDPISAVTAIMTTDTFPKTAVARFRINHKPVTIWACAKGSGMIHPNMATMFSFILTDALMPLNEMKRILKMSVEETFNSLTVDGDTSTNDCVFLLANGSSTFIKSRKEIEKFHSELRDICKSLAHQMALDGEGATKRVEIVVKNAKTVQGAKKIAETVATSPLVKTAIFGEDANWGRIMAAIGRAGIELDPNKIEISFNDLRVAKNGCAAQFSEEKAKEILKNKEIKILIDLHQGDKKAHYFTCDLSLDYVKINADYRS
jgi:glutamate N-acetyltransferase / amino-acid N-acetyltransferase